MKVCSMTENAPPQADGAFGLILPSQRIRPTIVSSAISVGSVRDLLSVDSVRDLSFSFSETDGDDD
jgi:hypothetical protein